MPTPAPLHLAVALDGAGWHPAARHEPEAEPQRLFTAGYWTELAQRAERGLLDFLTIEDGLDLQSDGRFQAGYRTATEADELIITTITHDHADRCVRTSCSPTSGPGVKGEDPTETWDAIRARRNVRSYDYYDLGQATYAIMLAAADLGAGAGHRGRW